MSLLRPGSPPPSGTHGDDYLLEPLRASHVQLDYEAVMETRARLRLWSQSDWPADDFTQAENLQDLEMHQQEHEQGMAFTYTILSPNRAVCLGCVYVKPLAPLFAEEHAAAAGERPASGARIAFWVRESRLADRLDRRVLDRLMGWFSEEWALDRVVFFTSGLEVHQQRLFEDAGLKRGYVKQISDGTYVAYLP